MTEPETPDPAALTLDVLDEFLRHIRDDPPDICGITKPHTVSPRDIGWTQCRNCFQAVKVKDTPQGKAWDLPLWPQDP